MAITFCPTLVSWGSFVVSKTFYQAQIWRLVSYQFLHDGTWHIFFNMLALYLFGPVVEGWLGNSRFLAFYLLCGIAGAVGYALLSRLGILIYSADAELVGASAAIFGVMAAAAYIAPNHRINIFGVVPMRLAVAVGLFVAMNVLEIVRHEADAGGASAHVAGAVMGWAIIRKRHWLNVFDREHRGQRRFWRPGDSRENFFRRDV